MYILEAKEVESVGGGGESLAYEAGHAVGAWWLVFKTHVIWEMYEKATTGSW